MQWTKVREKSAAIIAILFVVIFGTVAAAYFGFHIPIVTDLLVKAGIL
ncbi:MAG: hypothetical protein KAH38_05865 [Candidatus Hydrogenedentes bacterium]|nr:hypothetical protein [Candidatus Hydrogenedentota bacterium]